jgi:uncharacterized delta-60 repeat protein
MVHLLPTNPCGILAWRFTLKRANASVPRVCHLGLLVYAIFVATSGLASNHKQTAAPTISTISPKSVVGSQAATVFTISGANFVNGTSVQVGFRDNGYVFQNTTHTATFVSSSQLTIPITTGIADDTWQLRVKNPDGQLSNVTSFSVTSPPIDGPHFAAPAFLDVGTLRGLIAQAGGKFGIYGQFTAVNGQKRTAFATFAGNGTLDSSSLSVIDAFLTYGVAQSDGRIILAGRFEISPGVHIGLVRILEDGMLDNSFTAALPPTPPGYSDFVEAIVPQTDGKCILVYPLDISGNQTVFRRQLMRLNSDGARDFTFDSHNALGNSDVLQVLVQPDGKCVAVVTQPPYVRRLTSTGAVDMAFTSFNETGVDAMILQPDGRLIIDLISSNQSRIIVRLMPDGTEDFSFKRYEYYPDPFTDAVALAPSADGGVFVAPDFPAERVFKLANDGSLVPSYQSDPTDGVITAILPQPDGKLIVAGQFKHVGNVRCSGLARLSGAGQLDSSFIRPALTQPGSVMSIALGPDNSVAVAGAFSFVDGQPFSGVVKLRSDGSIEDTFSFDGGPFSVYPEVDFQSDGRMILDGLIRLTLNGEVDASFNPPACSPNTVLIQPDDKILVAGFFPDPDLQPRGVVRLNPDGTMDPSFQAPASLISGYESLALQPDGKILFGGAGFGSSLPTIARLNSDGTRDDSFKLSKISGFVFGIAVQPDQKVVLGGSFTDIDGIPKSSVARLNPDGGLDGAFDAEVNDIVIAVVAQTDGKVLLGGNFTAINGVPAPGLTRLNVDGSVDLAFNPGSTRSSVGAIAVLPNGDVLAGGSGGLVNVSISTPGAGQSTVTGSAVPFTGLVVTEHIMSVKEVRFFVNNILVDTQTLPLATNGYIGAGHADNAGSPGYDSAVYASDKFIPVQPGTYALRVDVLDANGNVTSSTTTTVTAVDPNQSPPPQVFDLGGLANGTALLANNSVIITAGPKTQGSGLTRLELLVNGTVAQKINVGATEFRTTSPPVTHDPATGNYTFTFTPKAPGTFGLNIRATGAAGVTTTSNTIAVTAGPSSRLLNISTRMFVDSGDNALIGGMIVTGSGQKKVLIRAIGPSLADAGLAGALQDPTLELHDGNGALIASNDDWGNSPDKQAVIDTTIAPSNAKESAILTTLPASFSGIGYTAIVKGANGTSGVGLVEVYDLDGNISSTRLANISTRGNVRIGDNAMIGGFIVGGGAGAAPDKVIVRAIGPSTGIFGALEDPTLELHQGPTTIASNNDWKENEAEIVATTIPPSDDRDSAIVRTLQPLTGTTGDARISTTAIVRGKNDGTGIALVEVYDLNK